MSRLRLFHLHVVLLAVVCLCTGCSSGAGKMTATTLHSLVDQGRPPVIVDVRSEGEFSAGHIPGAIHIPFYSIGKRHHEISADKDVPVLIYCAHGPRAWWASFVLRRKGFSQVTTLEGHYKQWQKNSAVSDKNNP